MKLHPSQREKISRIALASAVDEATDKDLAELDAILRDNPAAREYLVELMHLQTSLSWQHEKQDALALSGQVDKKTAELTKPTVMGDPVADQPVSSFWSFSLPSSPSPVTLSVFTLGLILAVGAFIYQLGINSDDTNLAPPTIVASLVSGDCTWAHDGPALTVGDPIHSCQRLELVSGVAKLHFKSGVTVVVESPAVIEPITQMSLRLVRGSVAVRSNGPRKDFTVISPEASIVDLGTSFGVYASGDNATEVEVFEGAVEIHAGVGRKETKVLGLGGAALVRCDVQGDCIKLVGSPEKRFDKLLEVLWDDIRQEGDHLIGGGSGAIVEAEFNDAPIPKTVDTFYGSKRGRGWVTPWVAKGNPVGTVLRENTLSGKGNPYLSLTFGNSQYRTVAREYGPRSEFDPRKPHVISWSWRFDGTADQFGGHYQDRVLFFGSPIFRSGTARDLSWIIGVVGAEREAPPAKGDKLRKFFPMRWYFYDRKGDGGNRLMDGKDMVDTYMTFKPGVIYKFAVAVYPQQGIYDAAIQDDEQIVTHEGLSFRDPDASRANVIHFSVHTAEKRKHLGFSLDSIHIEPLENGGLRRRLIEP